MNIFGGYEDLVDIFLGDHHKIGLVWGSFLCILGSFLRSRYRIGIFFWVAKISNIFYWVLEIPDIFLGWTVDAGSEPTYEEKIRVPPGVLILAESADPDEMQHYAAFHLCFHCFPGHLCRGYPSIKG